MLIEISDTLKSRIIDASLDELDYHIHCSDCPSEYATETLAQLELLHLLGEKDWAQKYRDAYAQALDDEIDSCKDRDLKEELIDKRRQLNKLWIRLGSRKNRPESE